MLSRFIKLLLSAQFLKFLMVGVTAAAANWFSRYGFDIIMSFSLSVICAYVLGMVVAFILNAIYVFPTSKRPRHLQARDFFAINMVSMVLVWIVSILLNNLFLHHGMTPTFSEPLAHGMALTTPVVLTFLFYKFVAFRDVGES